MCGNLKNFIYFWKLVGQLGYYNYRDGCGATDIQWARNKQAGSKTVPQKKGHFHDFQTPESHIRKKLIYNYMSLDSNSILYISAIYSCMVLTCAEFFRNAKFGTFQRLLHHLRKSHYYMKYYSWYFKHIYNTPLVCIHSYFKSDFVTSASI